MEIVQESIWDKARMREQKNKQEGGKEQRNIASPVSQLLRNKVGTDGHKKGIGKETKGRGVKGFVHDIDQL